MWDRNGWYPRLHTTNGKIYLAYGNGQTRIAEVIRQGGVLVPVRDELVPSPIPSTNIRIGDWGQPGIFTGFADTGPDQATRCLLDVKVESWVYVPQTGDNPSHVAGNEYAVTPDLWASWLAKQSRPRICISGDLHNGGGALCAGGRWVAHAYDGNNTTVVRHLGTGLDYHYCQHINYHNGAIASNGHCLYGGYGPLWGYKTPTIEEDLTVTPWRAEGMGACWVGSDGLTWIASTAWREEAAMYAEMKTRGLEMDLEHRSSRVFWTDGGRILIRPWGEMACVQVPGDVAAACLSIIEDGPDWLIAWCDATGILGTAVVRRDSQRFPVTEAPPVIEPPPIKPPIELPRPPAITITSYEPTSGEAPLKVRAVAALEPNSGPVTTIEWLRHLDGAPQWTVDATNPGTDLDHTYQFTEGVWSIAAKATGPGGTSQTQTPRRVTVTAAVTEPPTEPPPVQPPDVDEEFAMGAIILLAARLYKNESGNFPNRYHEKSRDGLWIASVDSEGNRTAIPTRDAVIDANESIEWIEGSPTAYYWPHPGPFDNKILCMVDLSERREDQTFRTRKNLQGEK